MPFYVTSGRSASVPNSISIPTVRSIGKKANFYQPDKVTPPQSNLYVLSTLNVIRAYLQFALGPTISVVPAEFVGLS